MATATATTTTHELKVKPVAKPKRRRCRGETTAIVSAVTPEAEVVPPTPPDSPFRVLFSPSPGMEFTSGTHVGSNGFTKFNSALTAGLLNPMSPPPPSAQEKTRSSPSLFEMMTSEPDSHTQGHISTPHLIVMNPLAPKPQVLPPLDKQALAKQRISDILASMNPGNLFNDSASSDIKLTLSSKDGINVSMNVHRQVLVAHSRFFAVKLSDQWMKQQKASVTYTVEIADCEDVEAYIESLRLMYCRDLRRMLMKEDVGQVLGILKVSTAIGFDAGVLSCLEYLEAAPWNEDEEEKVASLLSKLHFDGVTAGEVLKRVSVDVSNGTEGGQSEDIILKLLHIVLEGRDEKARRDMKGLVCKLLRENSSQNYIRKDSLYSACEGCLQLLRKHFLQAAESDLSEAAQIARQADNLQWILDILIDRNIAEDFLKTWASQSELSASHPKVPVVHRFEVSRVTARLFVGIGKGQLLASKDARCLLVRTWLVPFYDDFAWTRRASWGLDRHLIEEGLSNTILTLPLAWQQEIMLAWFDRFLNSDKDCPNIQRGFEVWWRRAFWRRSGEQQPSRLLQIAAGPAQNS